MLNPYESSPSTPAPETPLTWTIVRTELLTIVHLLIVAIVSVQLGAIVPAFMYFFEHEAIGLPWPTIWFCELSIFVRSYWPVMLPLWLVLDIGTLHLLAIVRSVPTWWQRVWHESVLLVTILFLFASTGAMMIPSINWYRQ